MERGSQEPDLPSSRRVVPLGVHGLDLGLCASELLWFPKPGHVGSASTGPPHLGAAEQRAGRSWGGWEGAAGAEGGWALTWCCLSQWRGRGPPALGR